MTGRAEQLKTNLIDKCVARIQERLDPERASVAESFLRQFYAHVPPDDIVDEALVMALPLAAMHEDADDCVEIEAQNEATIESTMVDEKMTTPFAALRAQMDDEQ